MKSDDLVLIAIMNNVRDLHIAKIEHWYRIPVKNAPKKLEDIKYLAFYLTKAFGEQKWSIPYWAKINGHRIVKRSELLPLESDHPRSNEEYYRLDIDDLKRLPEPIVGKIARGTNFIVTPLSKLKSAKKIKDLFDDQST